MRINMRLRQRALPRNVLQELQDLGDNDLNLTQEDLDSMREFASLENVTKAEAERNSKRTACDPFKNGLLTHKDASGLLDIFRTKLMPHFPFVIVSPIRAVKTLHENRPALCLAILSVASFGNVNLQASLGELFNELVSERMADGRLASLDMLFGVACQCLLVSCPVPECGFLLASD